MSLSIPSSANNGLSNYNKCEKLGEGTYGVVYRALDKVNNRYVALKKIKIDPNEEGIPATTLREVSLLKQLQHPSIIQLEKSLYINGELYLVFEFMDNDLKQYLDNCVNNLDINLLKSYSYLLLEGLRFCHARRILHRDLKPQNILISRNGDLKIADFGLGREHGLPICKLTHEVVTLWYRSPEILLGQEKYSGATDMWSVGCIIAEMATRQPFFPGDSEIDQLFKIFKILGTPDDVTWPGISKLPDYKLSFPKWKAHELNEFLKNSAMDDLGINLLKQILQYVPNKRITAKRALQHPWFDDIRPLMNKKISINLKY